MKQLAVIVFLLISVCSFGQNERDSITKALVDTAKSQLGVTYKWGTSNPNVSFDCSGFTAFVYGSMDLPNSRSSKSYGSLGTKVTLEECKPGDCIVFSGTQPGSKTIGHVGIILENNENGIKFIHCSSSKKHYGVVITDYHSSNYPKRFLQVRRLY